MTGKVFLVGAGPGDPGLITMRGARLIADADVIVMDALVNPRLVDSAHARIINAGKRGPASDNDRAHGPSQASINRLLVRLARAGHRVVRLKGGDPFVFGRGAEELETLRAAGIPFEVVPGVTSATAVPAYAGIPITDRRWASQVTFVTGHERSDKKSRIDWSRISPDGTLVILMGVLSWPELEKTLLKNGWPPTLPVAAIERGATPAQRVLRSSLKGSALYFCRQKLDAPAVLVVGRVAALSSRLAWVTRERPLFGRRLVVTRPVEGPEPLTDLLTMAGADVIRCPLIRVRATPPPILALLRLAASGARLPYDGLIFLSANAVRILAQLWPEASQNLAHVPVVAVGPATAEAATALGWRVKKVADEFRSSDVRRILGSVRSKRLLLPRSRIAPSAFVHGLERAGARVDVLPIYDTEFVEPSKAVREQLTRGVEGITFFSPSAVTAFASAVSASRRDRLFRTAAVFSVGPSTTAAVRKLFGVRPIEATAATATAVFEAIRSYFSAK